MRILRKTLVNATQHVLLFRFHMIECSQLLNEAGMRLLFGK